MKVQHEMIIVIDVELAPDDLVTLSKECILAKKIEIELPLSNYDSTVHAFQVNIFLKPIAQ